MSRSFHANWVRFAISCGVITLLTSVRALGYGLEGQNAPRNNSGTNYFGGPLRGWYELELIPCRVVLQPGSNQVVQINFDHTKNASIVKRGIQDLYTFSPSANVKITTPILTGQTSIEDWTYTFTADVTNNQTGYVYFNARMAGGAHLFGGSSLALFSPPLQLQKPGPVTGNPDLIITKTGPSTVFAGNSYTYSLTFSNKANATSTAVGVQLSDFLPPGTTYVPGSASASALATNLNVENSQLFWDVADLPQGASGTITYKVAVPSSFANGTIIQNYAQIESAQDDANETDNISIVTTTVLNSPPTANPDTYSINRNQTLTIGASGVLANDSDVNNLTLKSLLVTNVSNGTLALSTNGSFVYTPSNNFVGTDTFYYVATNGYTVSQPASVTINVLQFIAPSDTNVACLGSTPGPATNLTQFIAQGGIASSPYCGQATSVTFVGDAPGSGSGCPASPLVIFRTYKLTTGCGDTTSVVQKITVIDSSVPVITGFPTDATYSCASMVPTADDSLVLSTDNCNGARVVTHEADVVTPGSCANRYSIARTYRVSDSCGNTSSRTQHITVNDQTVPVITAFPVDATYSCANAIPLANDSLVTATDSCIGSVTISHDADIMTSSNCANRFTISRVYRATDSCGNATSQSQIITVNETTPPTITAFPVDATYSCANGVPAANDNLVTATSACGGTTGVIIGHGADMTISSNCVNRFILKRTYVATDACGNSVSKTQTITVNATAPPFITAFPSDATYSCASAVPVADDNLVTATNTCGGASRVTITHASDVVTSSNCINHFSITRTYIATDACGNSASMRQIITVSSATPPNITSFPNDATYSCSAAVPAADNSLVAAIDGCGGTGSLIVSHDADLISSSNCVSRFAITRVYRVTDACGNATSKSQTIIVNGTIAPTITAFPDDATYSCANIVPLADNALVNAIDNCGAFATVRISHDDDLITSSNCANRFVIARIYRATDACGNMSSKTQNIVVNGTTPPTIATFPADVTYSCANAVPAADNSLVSATDGCGSNSGMLITHLADIVTSSNCVNRFTITRVYVATDACGNSSSKSQAITVNGTTPPAITTFPADATYSCATAVPAADDTLVTATDGCGGNSGMVITHIADTVSSSNCVNRFTLTRTYVVTDACGNSSSKNQTITVNATAAPTIANFPADATYLCAGAVPNANDNLVSAFDGCGASSGLAISHTEDVISSSNCVNRFTITRTYLATDACGNSSSKSQTITVNGTTPPIIKTFPSDATYFCALAVPAADDTTVTAINSCGGNAGVLVSHNTDIVTSSNCVNRFTLSRTYIATDACGNSSTKTQIITVNGITPPAITTFPADVTFSCPGSVPAANDDLVVAADNCGSGNVTVTHNSDQIVVSNCPGHFTLNRTYRATDACGNFTSRTQVLTVNATLAPNILPPLLTDVTYSCAGEVPTADDSLVHAVDNCGGGVFVTHDVDSIISSNCINRFTIRRVYHVSDSCGNTTNIVQAITVNATTAPTFTIFPPDVTYTCSSAVTPADDTLASAMDGCGAGSVRISHAADAITSSTCDNRYVIRRNYIATDTCGNSSSKNQSITIDNTTPPTITVFPDDATYSCASEVPSPHDDSVGATNACGDKFGMTITHLADVIISSNCVNRFTIARAYIATDACGNSASKSQTLTVNALTPPTFTAFPDDVTYSCASAVPSANDALVAASDHCGGALVAISHQRDLITSSNCMNRFTITRAYVATDSCGNSSSKSQTIIVNGTTPPTITDFPSDATYSCAGDVPTANDTLVHANDNCGLTSTVTVSHDADLITSSNCVNRFTISRTYHAVDACGNAIARTQTIMVNATTPPTIATFPADATYSCASAVPSADNGLVTATDGCGANFKIVVSHNNDVVTSSNCVSRFTIARTYFATDACGNSTSKTQAITVNGTVPPTITIFPSDATFACSDAIPGASDNLVSAVDNCGAGAVIVTHDSDVIASNICANHFIVLRTYHVSDACGNTTRRTQVITVNDNIPPTISCPPGFTVSLFDGIPAPNVEQVIASDNCSVPIKSFVGETFVTNNCVVTVTRTFAATDDCGNSSTCSQIITMNPYLAQPSARPDSYSVFENTMLSIAETGVLANDTDPNNLPLRAILASSTSHGTLTFNSDGAFRYVPDTYYVGSDAFTYQPSNGGNTPGEPVTVSITVNPVNQPPSFTKGANQVVNNYDPAQTRFGWATTISAGPANESWQAVDFNVSNDNNSIFSQQPAISGTGTLTYAPAAGHYGTAVVSVKLKDNGGIANGGNDTSTAQTFSIIVNNPPISTINVPTNTSLFLYPSPIDVSATVLDLDGTVTNVTFLENTNVIGQGTISGSNSYTFIWTNAPASNSVLYALATDNYGATNLSAPINIQLGNPVVVAGGPIVFSPSLFSWGQKLSVTNPTISTVQSVTITFTSIQPADTSVVGVTGTNALGQPYIMFNNAVPPVTSIDNYANILFLASSKPQVTYTTSASLSAGPGFTVNSTNLVALTRHQFQNDGSVLLNFLSTTGRTYYVQYTSDLKGWVTSPQPLHGNGTQLQWVDFGPNTTESNPRSVPQRFYRVVAP